MQNVRSPAVSGQFYPGSKNHLIQRIKESFLDSRGCGSLPKIQKGKKDIKAIIVPHAGYIYSGPIASYAYHQLASNGFADTFIIIGPNHTGIGSGVSLMTEGYWETPLAQVKINKELAEKICIGIIDSDNSAHRYEHSIEVQLPFLQFISENKEFDFIPICMMMQDIETSTEIGNIIGNNLNDIKKKTVLIASSDFSHVGFNYSTMPPKGLRVDNYAKKQDNLAIEKILNLDSDGLIDTVLENNISMCGYGPIASIITASKKIGAKKAELLKYGTSYEVHPNSSCVGYGSIIIY